MFQSIMASPRYEQRKLDVSMLETAGIVHIQKRIVYNGDTHTVNMMKTCNGGIYLHAVDVQAVKLGRSLTYREEDALMTKLNNADRFVDLIERILKGDETHIDSFRINTSHCDYDVYLNLLSCMPQLAPVMDADPLPSKTEKTPPVIDEINYQSVGLLHIRRPFRGGHYVSVVKTCNKVNYARVVDFKTLAKDTAAVLKYGGIVGFEAFEHAVVQGDEMEFNGFHHDGFDYLKLKLMRPYVSSLNNTSAWDLLATVMEFMWTLPIPEHVVPVEGLARVLSGVCLDSE